MTLKEYIESLQEFLKGNPECENMLVITSKDDEGNGYNPVYFSPTKGIYEDYEFTSGENIEESGHDPLDINAVCVN